MNSPRILKYTAAMLDEYYFFIRPLITTGVTCWKDDAMVYTMHIGLPTIKDGVYCQTFCHCPDPFEQTYDEDTEAICQEICSD